MNFLPILFSNRILPTLSALVEAEICSLKEKAVTVPCAHDLGEFISPTFSVPKKGDNVICSTHFKAEDFVRRFMNTEGELGSALTPWLKRDDFGIAVFPSIHAFAVSAGKEEPLTDRDKRMVRYRMYAKYTCNFSLVVLKVIR